MEERRGLSIALIYLVFVIVVGVSGIMYYENKSLLDSFYLIVVCLSTVGLGGVSVDTTAGKLVTLFVILSGVGIVTYLFTIGTKLIIGGELRQALELKIMLHKVKNMKNHYIVCGIGESSLQIIEELRKAKADFVLIDINEEKVQKLQEMKLPIIYGDAESEEILELAGIKRAKGLIANLNDDSDNLFTVLTARTLNPNLFIVAKAIKVENIKKMKKVGADRVISPNIIGGRRMAASLLRTSVVDFLDLVISGQDEMELRMESLVVSKESELLNKKIKESGIREKSGVIIVGMKCDSDVYVNPDPNTVIKEGVHLIVLGKNSQINKFQKLL